MRRFEITLAVVLLALYAFFFVWQTRLAYQRLLDIRMPRLRRRNERGARASAADAMPPSMPRSQ